jgi:hypothetical protein
VYRGDHTVTPTEKGRLKILSAAETFLGLPHPEAAEYERRKTADRWRGGVRKLKAKTDPDLNPRGAD